MAFKSLSVFYLAIRTAIEAMNEAIDTQNEGVSTEFPLAERERLRVSLGST